MIYLFDIYGNDDGIAVFVHFGGPFNRLFLPWGTVVFGYLKHENRMSVGLGMSKGEWEELKSKVDDSFWVMRVIGKFIKLHKMALYHIQVV